MNIEADYYDDSNCDYDCDDDYDSMHSLNADRYYY